MKIEKSKHEHKLTHLLKVGIFAMLMIAPLFASCSQLMYVTFNKNAYQSTQITGTEYYTTYEYETNEVNSVDDLVVGNIYHLNLENYYLNETWTLPIDYLYINNFTSNTGISAHYATIKNIFVYNDYRLYVDYQLINNQYFGFSTSNANATINFDCYFVFRLSNNTISKIINYINASDYLGETTVNERPVQALDNAFYYGVEKMTESPLFNWTQNTALYTGIKAMTDNLQIQTNVIAVLVTYWTILTIIYIIIDIVLTLFTKMTHLLVRSD